METRCRCPGTGRPGLHESPWAQGTMWSGARAHACRMDGDAGQVPERHRPSMPAGPMSTREPPRATAQEREGSQAWSQAQRDAWPWGEALGRDSRARPGTGSWAARAAGPRAGLPALLTWMIRSPSRIRPSLAAMLLGFTCKADAAWWPGSLHEGSLSVARHSLTLGTPNAN